MAVKHPGACDTNLAMIVALEVSRGSAAGTADASAGAAVPAPRSPSVTRETVSLGVGDREIPIELFTPPPDGSVRPGVLVIHEVYGVNDDIRRIARRFAENGYVAAAPDLMAGGFKLRCIVRAITALRSGRGGALDELEAVIEWLGARPEVGKVGAAGFCLGGGFALLLGCRERVAASAVYYGEIRSREELSPACPLTGGYGGKDRLFRGKGRKLVATLDELGAEHDIKIYDDAGHSYMSDAGHPFQAWLSRPLMHVAYNEAAAEDSWLRMLAFFERHLS